MNEHTDTECFQPGMAGGIATEAVATTATWSGEILDPEPRRGAAHSAHRSGASSDLGDNVLYPASFPRIPSEGRWRQALEKQGLENVLSILRDHLQSGTEAGAEVMNIVSSEPFPTRKFVWKWAAKERLRRKRRRVRRAQQARRVFVWTSCAWLFIAVLLIGVLQN